MRHLAIVLALLLAVAVGAPPLIHLHTLPLLPFCIVAPCIAFAFYLMLPAEFTKFGEEARKDAGAWKSSSGGTP